MPPSSSSMSFANINNYLSARSATMLSCLPDCLPGAVPTGQPSSVIPSEPSSSSTTQLSSLQTGRPSHPTDQTHLGTVEGPPYVSRIAILGGVPSRSVDIPITSIFLVLFVLGAVAHMTTFRKNKARGHKFLPSFFIYVFCMARMVSCVMRIAWAAYPTDARIAIAAVIFVSAGVLLIFLVNLIFAQRLIRATQPRIGWHPALGKIFRLLFVLVIGMLAVSCFGIVQSFYTLDLNKERIDRDLQLGAMTYFLSIAFLPIVFVYISLALPRKTKPERFGTGRLRSKLWILTIAATLCTFGAAFRTGAMFMPPRRVEDPAWYQSKACFYLFNFSVEIIVVYFYLFMRVDQRFYVPNGSRGPGDYSARKVYPVVGVEEEEKDIGSRRDSFSSYTQIMTRRSSVYSFSISDESEETEESELSDLSSSSQSTLTLPAVVHQSRMSVASLPVAPYMDLQFVQKEEKEDVWLSLPFPSPVALRPSFIRGDHDF